MNLAHEALGTVSGGACHGGSGWKWSGQDAVGMGMLGPAEIRHRVFSIWQWNNLGRAIFHASELNYYNHYYDDYHSSSTLLCQ